MIRPTVGRILWYWPSEADRKVMTVHPGDQPLAATIAFAWSDNCVNLSVIDHDGASYKRTSVYLDQNDIGPPMCSPHCTWMPYQKGQAAANDQLKAQLGQNQQAAQNTDFANCTKPTP